MAVTAATPTSGNVAMRPVPIRTFARLKLRVMANGFRGQRWRVVLFVLGALGGLYFAGMGFLLFLLSGTKSQPEFATVVPAFGGAALVLGWFFVPLVWTGVDETLDPARFALLPLPRRTLVTGLLVAALLGIPAVATLLASTGLVAGADARGGLPAAAVQTVGVLLGLLVCVCVSRAVTSAFAALLKARRTRDLAAVVLALLAALLGPLQIAVLSAAQDTKLHEVVRVADVLGWTPLSAPYLIGFDVAEGQAGAAVGRALIAAATIVLLMWWWSRSLESAMLAAGSGGAGKVRRGLAGGAVGQFYPRVFGWLPRNQYGALVAREARYWWRDPRRRSSVITIAVIGVFVPFMVNLSTRGATDHGSPSGAFSPGFASSLMLMVGAVAAVSLANQFGFDGTAYAAHLVVGVPGRAEVRARIAGFSLIMVPILILVATVFVIVLGNPGVLPLMFGGLAASYGTGVALNSLISVLAAYPLPETSNPFALNTGAGFVKSILAFIALIGGLALAVPVSVAAALLPSALTWLVLPLGLGYGIGAALLGSLIAGEVLDRRAPELLAAVTPRR